MTTNGKPEKPLKKYICECCSFGCSQKSDFNDHLMTKKHKRNEPLFMTNGKPEKPLKKYICECCAFECSQKSDFNDHLMTNKHITNKQLIMTNKDLVNEENNYTCKCGKKYKHMSSLCKHKRLCAIKEANDDLNKPDTHYKTDEPNNKIIDLLINNNKHLQENNTRLHDEINEFKKLMLQLITENIEVKKSISELTKNGINSNNTNCNNNNKTTFNLNFFLNDKCKDAMNLTDFINSIQITYKDFIRVGSEGYVKGVSDIININMKKLAEIERPIHCTDEKRGTLYIKDENKWEKEEDPKKMNLFIENVARKSFKFGMPDYKKEFPDCTKSSSRHSNQYNKCLVEAMGGAGDNEDEKKDKITRSILKSVLIKTK